MSKMGNGDGWIRVEDRLPEFTKHEYGNWFSGPYLVFACGMVSVAEYTKIGSGPHRGNDGWNFWAGSTAMRRPDNRVTHWMPLPAPPEKEKP